VSFAPPETGGASAASRIAAENALARHLANPFLVLELPVGATRDEVERQGAKLLALLAAGVGGAASYATPLGSRERTAELVRAALAELREPRKRVLHEWWAGELAQGAPPGATR
jgi:hypothetical protein